MAKPEREYYFLNSLLEEWGFKDVREVLFLAISGDLEICCMADDWEFEYGFHHETQDSKNNLDFEWASLGGTGEISGLLPLSKKTLWEIAIHGYSTNIIAPVSKQAFLEKCFFDGELRSTFLNSGLVCDEYFSPEANKNRNKRDDDFIINLNSSNSFLIFDALCEEILMRITVKDEVPRIVVNDLFITSEEKNRVEKSPNQREKREPRRISNIWKTIGALVLYLQTKQRNFKKGNGTTNYSVMANSIFDFLKKEHVKLDGLHTSSLDERFKEGVRELLNKK